MAIFQKRVGNCWPSSLDSPVRRWAWKGPNTKISPHTFLMTHYFVRICFSFYNSPHLICTSAFRSFSYLWSTRVRKWIPLLTCHQKVNSSLTLGHVPTSLTCLHLLTEALYHFPSSQDEGWVQYNKVSGERDHSHVTFIQYRYHCSTVLFITVVSLFLCLIYKLNSVTGTCVHGKTHYIQLTLEHHEFEPHGSAYMWIFVQSSIINISFLPSNFS